MARAMICVTRTFMRIHARRSANGPPTFTIASSSRMSGHTSRYRIPKRILHATADEHISSPPPSPPQLQVFDAVQVTTVDESTILYQLFADYNEATSGLLETKKTARWG